MHAYPALLASFALAFLLTGCRSTQSWRKQADDRSRRYLSAAQQSVSGRTEEMQIETPADTLRRRLLLDNNLPVSDPASFGIRDLPENRYWKAEDRLLPGTDGGAAEFAPGPGEELEISLLDAVRIAAHNNREFQAAKEDLYSSALALDLENKEFRTTFQGLLSGAAATSRADGKDREGSHNDTASAGFSRKFSNGTQLSGNIAFNLAGMLDGDRATAWGSVADLSITIPLLRGSGRLIQMESLTQAERNLIYAVRNFEQKKRSFVVDIAGSYLNLLLAMQKRQNEDDNYKRVILSTTRSRRMADASRMSLAAYDQSYQSELSARASWIAACQSYESSLENFKMTLGLPPDAKIRPAQSDLAELQAYVNKITVSLQEASSKRKQISGTSLEEIKLEAPESVDAGSLKERTDRAIQIAFSNRLDFVSYRDRIEDAQRHLLIAEDAFRAEVTLGGSAAVGEAAGTGMGRAGRDHTDFKIKNASGSGSLKINLPFDRTRERNSYRTALIAVENAVRTYQSQEDSLKQTIRQSIRDLSQTEENLLIQTRAVELAQRRVRNQDLLLEAGRADMTDVLDAQAALVSAQNSLDSAMTRYRTSELKLQSTLGVLDVTVNGVWKETALDDLIVRSENVPENN